MWNVRYEMAENPVKMKLYYPTEGSEPKPCQPYIDAYKQIQEAEERRAQQIAECIRKIDMENK